MRRRDYTLHARAVTTTLACHLAACLHLRDYKQSVPARLLSRLLLLAAATGRSLSDVTARCAAAPSEESVRKALHSNLPADSVVLLEHLLAALHQLTPPRLRRRPVGCALDLHLRPFYGDERTPGTTGGKRQAGTDRFWAYATLVVLVRGLRLTVGLCPVDRTQSLAVAVRAVVEQARRRGVRIAWLLLDRGFYDAQVVAYLQAQGIPFVMPLIRRGDPEAGTGTRRFFRAGCRQGWYAYGWTARPRVRDPQTGRTRKQAALAVRVAVCVVRRPRGKVWAFAAWGVDWDPALVARRYRRRWGIETSYRQLGQCLAKTTSTDEKVRLLYVGLALLLRQDWAWLHYEVLAEREAHRRRLRPELLRLADLTAWLLLVLSQRLGYRLEVPSANPFPPLL